MLGIINAYTRVDSFYRLLILLFFLDMLDGVFTLNLVHNYGTFIEVNPIILFFLQIHPAMLLIFKLFTFAMFCSALVLGFKRRSPIIYPALFIALAVFFLVNCYHVGILCLI